MKKYLICFLCVLCTGVYPAIGGMAIPVLAAETQTPKDESPKNNYNIVMIVLDACRADHLGCYGYDRPTSPNIDKLAAESIIFEQAYSQGIQTFVSFSSFHTGKYPITLNAYWDGRNQTPLFLPLQQEELTLAEILRTYNYSTIAFPTGLHPAPCFGLSQGFQIYTNNPDFDFSRSERIDYEFVRTRERDGRPITFPIWSFQDTLPLALKYIKSAKSEPFFLLVHTNDTHPPYDNPAEFAHKFDPDYQGPVCKDVRFQIDTDKINGNKLITKHPADAPDTTSPSPTKEITLSEKDLKHIIAHYDGGVAYADNGVGKILQQLSDSKLMEKTIIILLADHGDGLGERGYFGRSSIERDTLSRLVNELCRVPLIIKHPGIKTSKRISQPVQLIDLMPTILDFLSIKPPHTIDGISLKELILNGKPLPKERMVITELRPDKLALRIDNWELIYADGRVALFNLKDDPEEKNNLANKPETKKIQEELLKKLRGWQKEHIAKRGSWIKYPEPNTGKDKKPPVPSPAPLPPPPPGPDTPK